MTKPDDMQQPSTSADNTGEPMGGAGTMAEADQDMDTMEWSGDRADMMSGTHADAALTEMAPPDDMTADGSG